MRTKTLIYIVCILQVGIISTETILAQTPEVSDSNYIRVLDINKHRYQRNDTVWEYSGICKPLKLVEYRKQQQIVPEYSKVNNHFISIHGNIRYDYLFRSFADTPYYQKDFRQHTVQTTLLITIKDQYPLRVNLVLRKSNSPFFKNFLDGGLLFDRYTYLQQLKKKILERVILEIPGKEYLDSAKALLKQKLDQFSKLREKLSNNGLAQEIIEEREKLYYQAKKRAELKNLQPEIPGLDSTKNKIDSIKAELTGIIDKKKKELDSLKLGITKLQKEVDSMMLKTNSVSAALKQKLFKIRKSGDLFEIQEYQEVLKGEKFGRIVSNLKTAGIGRTTLNYTELTARDVSLTGINLEYTPHLYYAVAAGKVDYGFRDFFGRNTRSPGQYLFVGRIGTGDVEKMAVIFSVYSGRKANYAGFLSDSVKNTIAVTGYSVEAIIRKNEEAYLTAEFAKSTRPLSGNFNTNKETGSLFRFNDNTNLGVSVKGRIVMNATDTKFEALFRKTGKNFQSFSLFTYNTDQVAWMLKAEQPLFRDRVTMTGIIRRNDFVNPFTEKTYKTTTVFGTAQLSVRFPKCPSVNIGYYPGSQLYIVNENRIRENVYYIVNGSIIHNYKLLGARMVSSVIYNKYINKGTDSGFINYAGINYLVSQAFIFKNLQVQSAYTYTDQVELKFYVLESTADLEISKTLRAGVGLKYNKMLSGRTYWGESGQLLLTVRGLGSLQLQYEKSFLPTIHRDLFPVELGRLTWYKYF